MKTLSEYLNESKLLDFDFSEFCNLLDDKAYEIGDWGGGVSSNVIYIKNIFGTDIIRCTAAGKYSTGQIIRPATPENAEFIYVDRSSKKCIGVRCKKFGFMYIYDTGDLKKCFGEENLTKIYKFISAK